MSDESPFPFEVGDKVRVKVREHGTSGNIIAKFEAECSRIEESTGITSPRARFDLPFGTMNSVTLRAHEAEFEVMADA